QSGEAIKQADAAVTVRQALARQFEAERDRTEVRRELAAAIAHRGGIHYERGELGAAPADYLDAPGKLDAALRSDLSSVGLMAEKAAVLGRIAQAQLRLGRIKEGLKSAEAALEISARLEKADPSSALARRELAAGHERLGDALLANARPADALVEYE